MKRKIQNEHMIYYVSEISACIGENPYQDISDNFEKKWLKKNKESYYECINRKKNKNNYAFQQKQLYKALKTNEAKEMSAISSNDEMNITEKVENISNQEQTANTTLSKEQFNLVKEHIKSTTSTQYGTKREQHAFDIYNENLQEKAFKEPRTYSFSTDRFEIRGQIDGRINENKIIEIKNRTKRLFFKVTQYEYCQCQLYMKLTNSNQCDLIECFNKQINVDFIEADETYIQNVIQKLTKFDETLEKIQFDKQFQNEYFDSDDKSSFLLHIIT